MKPKSSQRNFLYLLKTQGLQKGIVLKSLANIKQKISISGTRPLKYFKKLTGLPKINVYLSMT